MFYRMSHSGKEYHRFQIAFYSLIQQIFIDYLIWPRYCSVIWAYSSNKERSLCSSGVCILGEKQTKQNRHKTAIFHLLVFQVHTYQILPHVYGNLKKQYIIRIQGYYSRKYKISLSIYT